MGRDRDMDRYLIDPGCTFRAEMDVMQADPDV